MTEEQYYNSPHLHGNYQYVSLKDIIDNMLSESLDEDSYLKNISRSKIIKKALEGIRKLNTNTANDILAIEITVPDSLYITMPFDYVNWVRVSVIIDGALQPLNENKNINTAIGYLQDHRGELLFDNKGMVLTADSGNIYNTPYKRYTLKDCCGCGQSNVNNKDIAKYGEFVVDDRRGSIAFSSDLMDKDIVLEYISDGLQADLREEEVTIHKFLQEPLENWIYYSCIERKRNVPANEKQRALMRYQGSLHQAKLDRMNVKLYEILRRV
jgi:hypothetical protein